MLDSVVSKENKFNNNKRIADSKILSKIKVIYYRILIALYAKLGNYTDLIFTNSTWTDQHIKNMWKSKKTILLYPPCNIEKFLQFPLHKKELIMLSFAQFRYINKYIYF